MTTVGIRDLKSDLSRYVSRAAGGEQVMVTDRGRPVALLGPLSPELRALQELQAQGVIRWSGGKPGVLHRSAGGRRRRHHADLSGAVTQEREARRV